MHETLPRREIVLLGIGHTNAHVLRQWRMTPLPDTRLTCLSLFSRATYSGMLPAVLAGQVAESAMELDLVRLCAAAGARLLLDPVASIDRQTRRIFFSTRPPIGYDILSLGIGSEPELPLPCQHPMVVPIKPMQTFLDRLRERVACLVVKSDAAPALRVLVVGGGAGGVEIALCLPPFLQNLMHGPARVEVTLIDGHHAVPQGATPAAQRRVMAKLAQHHVHLRLGGRVVEVTAAGVRLEDGQVIPADLAIWATRAAPPNLLQQLGLACDRHGFVLVRPTLQALDDDHIFVVGDAASPQPSSIPKAGVYAVRQGPVLWHNLTALVGRQPLQAYHPQRRFLRLINTGDGDAIAEYGAWAWQGAWVRRWKEQIDGRFMRRYQIDSVPSANHSMAMQPLPMAPRTVMRCAGCGSKVNATILHRVLKRLAVSAGAHVQTGVEQLDDIAIVRTRAAQIALTTDFFRVPFDDHYLNGRIAALHALSDLYTLNAIPSVALAQVTIPTGPPAQQESLLEELLGGGLDEFRRAGVSLVGGHTVEGPETVIGFTLLAEPLGESFRPLPFQAGDQLVLTKPLGIGTLLAAHARGQCRAGWMDDLRSVMLSSNRLPREIWERRLVSDVTDVTGFGLAGHLLDRLTDSACDAELWLSRIPLLPGFAELWQQGMESTLAPGNRAVEAAVQVAVPLRPLPQYAALFDPQTSGGLLLGVTEARLEEVLALLRASGHQPVCIGKVRGRQESAANHLGTPQLWIQADPER